MKYNDLQSKNDQLELQGQILTETEEWWAIQTQMRISEFNFLQENLMNKWDENKAQRLESLQREIAHLMLKSKFEQKEIEKYQKNCDEFQKLQQKAKLIEFSKNLKKINKHFDK